ncbi:group II intron reverse transcriptase/maturase, partial [Frankia sp. CiP3]|uniref:group II intron reverse transcriptase/maturase n=1 Tax=Frankia sp. CiP3 TaxID=2880971 RepID=UPI00272EB4B9
MNTDFSIVAQFQAEFRGVAEYYRLAFNRHRLGYVKYVMERSLTKTLARKYRITVPQVYRSLPSRTRHRERSASWPSGHGAPGWRTTATGRTLGRYQSGTGHHATAPQRQSATHMEWASVRACSTAPGRGLRTMRLHGTGRSAP